MSITWDAIGGGGPNVDVVCQVYCQGNPGSFTQSNFHSVTVQSGCTPITSVSIN
jgi:hypothetical protein